MAIRFQCPRCGNKLSAKSDYAGKQGKCKCGTPLIVPGDTDRMKFACPHCGKGINVSNRHAGKRAKCPTCKAPVTIPLVGIRIQPQVAPAPVEQIPVAPAEESIPVIEPELVSTPAPIPAAPITVTCLMCSAVIKAKPSAAGKIIECPKCGSYMEVPGGEESTKPAAETEQPPAPQEMVPCPSCNRQLPDTAPVCTKCGIFVESGRPILTAWDVDKDELEDKAHGIVRYLSWLIPFGIYPVYSEAMGNHKPWATWGIVTFTCLVSLWFLLLDISGSPKMMAAKNLMLWNDSEQLDPEYMQLFYDYTSYGDAAAFSAKREELSETTPENELDAAAYKALDSRQKCFGSFHFYQLVTHAFLHGGIMHLAGNMLFLIVLGSRVNAAVGNIWMVILYPILAVVAAATHMMSMSGALPTPMLGASGAIMGLAGAYLLLYPVHKIYMVIWMRWGLIAGFHLSFKCFALRGFWVVLFYIMFDVIAVSMSAEDGTAHWAHIGGLVWGFAIALVLLTARLVYSRSDILSLVLGKYAWALIGTPAKRLK